MKDTIKSIHPFPARMAPEIALESFKKLAPESTILDPMMGSGTSLKVGASYGHKCIGFDLDPMAILISNVWNSEIDPEALIEEGNKIVTQAKELDVVSLPWIDDDKETSEFIDYWFAEGQKKVLRKLSFLLLEYGNKPLGNALKVALSRLIITKEKGASLGRDISHSRPHKVKEENDYQVFEGFQKSVNSLSKKLAVTGHKVYANFGDARNLDEVQNESIDFIITSPPYLHAVDYLRGHRLSLVWLGYKLNQLRLIRSNTVGIERKPDNDSFKKLLPKLIDGIGPLEEISEIKKKFILRYAIDLSLICKEMYRVLKPGKNATVVIADSFVSGNLIKNTQTFKNAASLAGFNVIEEIERKILASRRYLPPPKKSKNNNFSKRMKTEAVITFCKPN
jgi:hypothetical protein